MEKEDLTLEEFVDKAWEDTLTLFGDKHSDKEKDFKKLFLDNIRNECNMHKSMIEWVNRGGKKEDLEINAEQLECLYRIYKEMNEITIVYRAGRDNLTPNLRNAIIEAGISKDGFITGEYSSVKSENSAFLTVQVNLPLEYEFNLDNQKKKTI